VVAGGIAPGGSVVKMIPYSFMFKKGWPVMPDHYAGYCSQPLPIIYYYKLFQLKMPASSYKALVLCYNHLY
jgi:hypothetical protein